VKDLVEFRKSILYFYSPYNFIREASVDTQLNNFVFPQIEFGSGNSYKVHVDGFEHQFVFQKLPWDTSYFGMTTYKLSYVLFAHRDESVLTKACSSFIEFVFREKAYLFIEIPSEDILLIQALCKAGFALIETRLTYYRGNLDQYNEPRYAVRKATEADSQNLMRVAREMRNEYDRFHADSVFSTRAADEFLATYVEQSLKGFSDVVLTSGESGLPSDSFLTAKYFKSDWNKLGVPVSKMVLSAVSANTNKGWYKKLISEMTYHLRDVGAKYIFMNTQSTNRAVFYTWEKLGYSLGCATHVLSVNNLKES